MKNKRLRIILTVIAILLLIPFVAMQLTDEVNWTSSDFVIMGILLLGTGLIIDLVLRKVKNPRVKIVMAILVLMAFILVWVELAVGLFGTPFAGS